LNPPDPIASKASRLKVALQKSGRLTDNSLDLLVRCGLKYSRGKDQLMCFGENMPLDVMFVRDDDIPDLVQEDVCDLGILGLNVIEEKRLAFQKQGLSPLFDQLMTLDYGKCRLSIAVPDGVAYTDVRSLRGKRIATTYPNILERYLLKPGPCGFHLRPGIHRLDIGRESPVGSGNHSRKPGRDHHHARGGDA
jgi:ATP phosphoribosyltransferase